MAAETGTIWAIDIGNNSLKALCLSTERGVVEVIGFDNLQHGKILSGGDVSDAEREELIALTLRQFVTKYDLSMEEVIVSVPSQNSFARFVTLPPVESKRIPEMVKFEAVQQIPFGIDDVQWDWQLMTESDSPEIKVGIFAIKNDVVDSELEYFNREDIPVGYVQMAPMSLYNYLLYDRPDLVTSDSDATVVLNIGAETTDLVVCTKSAVWQRCILIGGNAFTKAIADAFKLNFQKAEKLKRTAPVSKYARQIFQAMRPVFADLASEVQRSLNFYNSSEPDTKIKKIIALGGGTKLRGLLKYLQQTLQIPVERPDSFKRLAMGPGVAPAKFLENVSDFGIVYGLALQGLGLGRIESNLLPRNIARSMAWTSKGKYFITAACLLLVAILMYLARTGLDNMTYAKNSQIRQRTNNIIRKVDGVRSGIQSQTTKAAELDTTIEKQFELLKNRGIIPQLHETIISALPNEKNNPEYAQLYKAFDEGDMDTILSIPRKQRKQIFINNISAFYSNDIANAEFGGADAWRQDRGMGPEGMMDSRSSEANMEMLMLQYSRMGITDQSLLAGSQDERKQGFVVTIIGYSPYGQNINDLSELIDPHGVDKQMDKWGLVTRLEHLDALAEDGNSPFMLYERNDPEQFSLEIKEINAEASENMPSGIGVLEPRFETTSQDTRDRDSRAGENVLKDPMTKEIISKIKVYDETGRQRIERGQPLFQVNDHWFVLNVKLIWKDAPEPPEQAMTPGMMNYPGMY